MYFEDSEMIHRVMLGAIVYSYLSYIESAKHNFEKKWLLDKQFWYNLFWILNFFFSSELLLTNSGQFINGYFSLQSQQHGWLSSFVAGKYVP